MSTIEGGMICTNDKNVYQNARLFRSHGMVRESNDIKFRNNYLNSNPELKPRFYFCFSCLQRSKHRDWSNYGFEST